MQVPELEFERMHRTARILWGAFLAATIAYLGVGYLIVSGRSAGFGRPPVVDTLYPVLLLVGAAVLAGSLIVPRRLLTRAHGDPASAVMGAQFAHLIGWAMAESIGILGLVLVILGGRLIEASPFFVAAFALILRQRPDLEALRRRIGSGSSD